VLAQEAEKGFFDVPQSEESASEKGRPLDGYIATAVFVALALFLIGKSARR
jgi:hypothetical protein